MKGKAHATCPDVGWIGGGVDAGGRCPGRRRAPAGSPTPAAIDIAFTARPESESVWSTLWWFLLGLPTASLSVIVPYGFWLVHPEGHRRGRVSRTPLKEAWGQRNLGRRLPGITSDWNLKETGQTDVGLAAAVFTTVLADTDPLMRIIGADAAGPLAVVTVAAALTAWLIGTGPLCWRSG